VLGIGGTQKADNLVFGETIDFRDIIARPFSGDLKAI
jgi:hypothetical protein